MDRDAGVLRLLVVLACVGCSMDLTGGFGGGYVGPGGPALPCTPPTSLAITPAVDSVEAGRAIPLVVSAPGAAGACDLRGRSSDSAVARVARVPAYYELVPPSKPVQVVGVAPGAATIMVEVRALTATAQVRVLPPRTSFVSVAGSCAIDSDDRTYCWGFNDAYVPMRVPFDSAFRAVTTATTRACGITAGGGAWCWGWIWSGSSFFGTGGAYHPEPAALMAGVRFLSVHAGMQDHACGITSDSAAMCWGDNAVAQLGLGYQGGDIQSRPQPVAGGLLFAGAVAGGFHSCALTGSGAAYCWGMAFHGQLGNGQMGSGAAYPAAPVAVSGGLTFRQLSAGQWHTCGLTHAGTAYCWGHNEYGQLGTGDTYQVATPQEVAGGIAFTSLGTGVSFTCGLTDTGDVYCWGINPISGQVALVPARLETPLRFHTLSVGAQGACGLASDARAYCWGFGILGDGAATSSITPVRVSGQP